jgi:hypothetical protein
MSYMSLLNESTTYLVISFLHLSKLKDFPAQNGKVPRCHVIVEFGIVLGLIKGSIVDHKLSISSPPTNDQASRLTCTALSKRPAVSLPSHVFPPLIAMFKADDVSQYWRTDLLIELT